MTPTNQRVAPIPIARMVKLLKKHQVLFAEGVCARKDTIVCGCERPWKQLSLTGSAFAKLEDRNVEAKWEALSNYSSELEFGRPFFTRAPVNTLATVRGVQVKAQFAEGYENLRFVTIVR